MTYIDIYVANCPVEKTRSIGVVIGIEITHQEKQLALFSPRQGSAIFIVWQKKSTAENIQGRKWIGGHTLHAYRKSK
jgi:hypothetical protein